MSDISSVSKSIYNFIFTPIPSPLNCGLIAGPMAPEGEAGPITPPIDAPIDTRPDTLIDVFDAGTEEIHDASLPEVTDADVAETLQETDAAETLQEADVAETLEEADVAETLQEADVAETLQEADAAETLEADVVDALDAPDAVTEEAGFNFCSQAPAAFDLQSPANNVTGVSIQPLVIWQASSDSDFGDGVTYQLKVCTDNILTQCVINKSNLTDNQYQVLPAEQLLTGKDYYYGVAAQDKCPTIVQSTPQVFHFITALPVVCTNSPSAFSLLSPLDGVVNVSTTPKLDWTDSTDPDAGDAVTYRLIVADNPSFNTPAIDKSGLTVSEYTLLPAEALAANTNFYWKVEASDTCAHLTTSDIKTFKTAPACIPHTIFETANWTLGTINPPGSLDPFSVGGALVTNGVTYGGYIVPVNATLPNNIGSGATVTMTMSNPNGTNITIDTQNGDCGSNWSAWLPLGGGGLIQIDGGFSHQCAKVRFNLTSPNVTDTPQLKDYTIPYCTY